MKKFTRFLSTFLAVIMLVSLSIVASAAGDTGLINNQLEESLEPMLMGELKDTFGEDIDVEYLDDYDLNIAGETNGYYEHSVTYETVPATEIELNVSEYTNFDVNYSVASAPGAAIRAYSVVEPTHIMTEAELAERNDY